MKKRFKLKNVEFIKYSSGYIASGNSYDNPKFFNGQYIFTSTIKKITNKPAAIHTQNSIYYINKKELPAKNTELWSLLYGVELPAMELKNAVHHTKKQRKVRKSTKPI